MCALLPSVDCTRPLFYIFRMPCDHWTLVTALQRSYISSVRPLGRLAAFQRASKAYTDLVHASGARCSVLRVKLESDTGSRIIGTSLSTKFGNSFLNDHGLIC